MTLDDKHDAIEALLCAGSDANNVSLNDCTHGIHGGRVSVVAKWAIDNTYDDITKMRFGDRMTEAAYRLIESSPTLRREWSETL